MKPELLSALRGERRPIGPQHRAMMIVLGTVLMLVNLVILRATLINKHYIAFAIIVLPVYVIAKIGGVLFRVAVVSPSAASNAAANQI